MRKLAIFAFSFAAATALYVYLLPSDLGIPGAAILLAAGIAFCFFGGDRSKRIRLAAFGAAVGLLWSWGYERLFIAPTHGFSGQTLSLEAEVCDYPEQTASGCCLTVRYKTVKIRLYLDETATCASLGDTIRVDASLTSAGAEGNLYYLSKDIALTGFQRGECEIISAKKLPLRYYPKAATQAVRERINRIFPEDTAGFMRALLTGDRSGLSYQTQNQMSVAGISHVVAVSGMHVSLVVGFVSILCLRRRRLAAVVSIAAMFFFAAMLGFSPSVLRAAAMNSIALLAPLFRRENDAPTSLGAVLLVTLLPNPWAVANVSLQLSYGAMAGILLFCGPLFTWMNSRLPVRFLRRHRLFSRMVRGIFASLATSLSAMVFTVPLVAVYFGVVSVAAPVSNLLLLPLLSAVFTLGCAAVLMSFFWSLPGQALAQLISLGIRLALWVIRGISSFPYAAVYTDSFYVTVWLITAYALLSVLLFWRPRQPLTFCCALLCTFLGTVFFASLPRTGCTVTAFDVGQGQCILLESGGMTAMVDCGGDQGNSVGEETARKLLAEGKDRIDVLILTHFDTDHVGGIVQLLSRVQVEHLLLPETGDANENRAAILRAAQDAGVSVEPVTEDITVSFRGGEIFVYAPMGNGQNAGLTALMSVDEYDILITGDMSASEELKLLAQKNLPDVEVLVAGHHGSKSSTSVPLLTALSPEIVLISVGENSYGHPAQETLDRIGVTGALVLRTDLDGDITITR